MVLFSKAVIVVVLLLISLITITPLIAIITDRPHCEADQPVGVWDLKSGKLTCFPDRKEHTPKCKKVSA